MSTIINLSWILGGIMVIILIIGFFANLHDKKTRTRKPLFQKDEPTPPPSGPVNSELEMVQEELEISKVKVEEGKRLKKASEDCVTSANNEKNFLTQDAINIATLKKQIEEREKVARSREIVVKEERKLLVEEVVLREEKDFLKDSFSLKILPYLLVGIFLVAVFGGKSESAIATKELIVSIFGLIKTGLVIGACVVALLIIIYFVVTKFFIKKTQMKKRGELLC